MTTGVSRVNPRAEKMTRHVIQSGRGAGGVVGCREAPGRMGAQINLHNINPCAIGPALRCKYGVSLYLPAAENAIGKSGNRFSSVSFL